MALDELLLGQDFVIFNFDSNHARGSQHLDANSGSGSDSQHDILRILKSFIVQEDDNLVFRFDSGNSITLDHVRMENVQIFQTNKGSGGSSHDGYFFHN